MSARYLVIFLCVLLVWTGLTTHEAEAADRPPGAVLQVVAPGDGIGADGEGTVDDHHLDDVGSTVHDLPDAHIQCGFRPASPARSSGAPHAPDAPLCSAHLPGLQRPPRIQSVPA